MFRCLFTLAVNVGLSRGTHRPCVPRSEKKGFGLCSSLKCEPLRRGDLQDGLFRFRKFPGRLGGQYGGEAGEGFSEARKLEPAAPDSELFSGDTVLPD